MINLQEVKDELCKYNLVEEYSDCDLSKVKIENISYNSKDMANNILFVCKGEKFKTEYLAEAVKNGVVSYISERIYETDSDIPYIKVSDIRKAMAVAAAFFYDYPYSKIKLIGITGTKGKTTTTYYMKNILDEYLQKQSGVISTVEVFVGDKSEESHLTTPEPIDLQRHFFNADKNNVEYLTMEVSSQAYKMQRVFGVKFDYGIFLNIGVDHISPLEHPDFNDYLSCKLEFVKNCKTMVINGQTDEYEKVMNVAKNHCDKIITYGTTGDFDYNIRNIVKEDGNFVFEVYSKEFSKKFKTKMQGRFNIENAAAAIAVAKTAGIDDESIYRGIAKTEVKGRMNVFEKNGVTAIVDYAHNYVSFLKLYESIKLDYPNRRIITLFGCPGGKAFLRRKDIAELTGQNAQYIYLTSEDPQFEEVENICQDIIGYLKPYDVPFEIIEDRKIAIETALSKAQTGDIVILAGKGEELYQKVKGKYVPYESDLIIVKNIMN